MYANYHTHTYLCKHAEGEPLQYVENAIKSGFKILGFSDHVPCPYDKEGYVSCIRMDVEQTAQYVSMISALRDEYSDRIKIYIGYEAEYYPKLFEPMLDNLRKNGCDYLILGQHFLHNEYDSVGASMRSDDPAHLTTYVDQVITGMSTGKFTYLAHPDVTGYRADEAFFIKEMTRLCEAAKEYDMPLEINLLGILQGRWYPYDVFWRLAKKVGNDVIIGCDAHFPELLLDTELIKSGYEYAESFGITPIETVEFRKI